MHYLNEKEDEWASRFLFLSMAIIVIDQDLKIIEEGPFKIKEPYLELLQRMAHQARTERKALRKKMSEHQIDVVFLQKNKSFSTYLFLTKGYEEERRYFNPAIRKKVEEILFDLMRAAYRKQRNHYHGAL